MAVGNALLDMWAEMKTEIGIEEEEKKEVAAPKKEITPAPAKGSPGEKARNPCPVCKSELVFEGGCNLCKNCGWSRCS